MNNINNVHNSSAMNNNTLASRDINSRRRWGFIRSRISVSFALIVMFVSVFITATGFQINNNIYASTMTANSATGYVNADSGAYLRSGTSIISKKVKTLSDNTKLTIYKEVFTSKTSTSAKYKWYYVKAGDTKGYIRSDLVDGVKYAAVNAKITAKCNYRVGPGTKMTVKGSFSKGKALMVYVKANPVSSVKGSSSTWYKVKYNSKYYYVSSTYVDIVGSIFTNNTNSDTSTSAGGSTSSATTSSFAKMTDAEFTAYLTKQGFPSSYRSKLLKLHKKHPNWVFKAKKTGINWNSAVTKENANGVSLIEGSQPVSYRATDSKSFRSASMSIYKSASTSSTRLGSIASNTSFTLLDEVWKGTTPYLHIKTKGGIRGYVYRKADTQSYSSVIKGVTTTSVNMRKGAGTSNSVIKSVSKGSTLSIVLQAKDSDGKVWYKVKTSGSNSYGYVYGKYVKVSDTIDTVKTVTTTTLSTYYPIAETTAKTSYRATPDTSYPSSGSWAQGTKVTIISKIIVNGTKWYQVNKDNKIVYAKASYFNLVSGPTAKAKSAVLEDAPDSALVDDQSSDEVDSDASNVNNNTDIDAQTESNPDTDTQADSNQTADNVVDEEELNSDEANDAEVCSARLAASDISVPSGKLPSSLYGTTNTSVNYRKGAGTQYALAGTLSSGVKVTVTGVTTVNSVKWYSISKSGSKYYMCADYVNLNLVAAPEDSFPTVKKISTTTKVAAKPSSLSGKGTIAYGVYIPKDGSNWFNAKKSVVAYYMDPRNFINEDRIYMFEDLSYQKDYQTTSVVSRVLAGSRLPGCGFTSKMFVTAGAKYKISPVFLAARARQETGGGSVAINGTRYSGVVVFNPFNIGATSSSNPVWNGMRYAYSHGWTTQTKAVNGGANFMASGYINVGQNSNYYQRFNVAKGLSYVGTHQYMTNVQAPYHESYSSGTSYKSFGITNQPLTFIIPVFTSMPGSTQLPE